MTVPSPPSGWPSLPSSSIVDALHEDEDVEDIVPISGAAAPDWLKQLTLPTDWQILAFSEAPNQTPARVAAFGPLGDGEWKAADTVGITGFTGWPSFYDLIHNADGALQILGSSRIDVKALPVPPLQWTAAVRSSGTAALGDRSVWIQQSSYVAGSQHPHASRLIVHTILVNSEMRERLSDSISQLSADIYSGFINALVEGQRYT